MKFDNIWISNSASAIIYFSAWMVSLPRLRPYETLTAAQTASVRRVFIVAEAPSGYFGRRIATSILSSATRTLSADAAVAYLTKPRRQRSPARSSADVEAPENAQKSKPSLATENRCDVHLVLASADSNRDKRSSEAAAAKT